MTSHLTNTERRHLIEVAGPQTPATAAHLTATVERIVTARLDTQRQALADLITRHEAHDGRVPACQLRAVLGMPARDRRDR